MITQIRQGDVLLIRRAAPTSALTRREDLAGLRVPGERTGHAHVLPAEVYDTDRGKRLLRVAVAEPMVHEEHAPVMVPAGWWEPVLQREFTPHSRPAPRAWFD